MRGIECCEAIIKTASSSYRNSWNMNTATTTLRFDPEEDEPTSNISNASKIVIEYFHISSYRRCGVCTVLFDIVSTVSIPYPFVLRGVTVLEGSAVAGATVVFKSSQEIVSFEVRLCTHGHTRGRLLTTYF